MLSQTRQLLLRRACKVASTAGLQNNYCTIGDSKAFTGNIRTTAASQWQPIYQFQYIKAIAGLNKLKIYQAALTSAAVPVTIGLEIAKQLPAGSAEIVGILGITGTITLCIASYFTKNFIGFVYVSQVQPNTVRLSHIDFWGKRKDIELSIDDIVAVSEHPKILLDMWVPVKTISKNESYKLLHRHGHIIDTEQFTNIFGEC